MFFKNTLEVWSKKYLIAFCSIVVGVEIGAAQSSVLSSGTWYKIGVTQSGMYKITPDFLRRAGVNTDQIQPQTLQIYGNGGAMLPQNTSTPRIFDLAENPIYVAGESDGRFDSQDYLLFYAQGPDVWNLNTATGTFFHTTHTYTDTAYYFLTFNQQQGKRVVVTNNNVSAGADVFTTFDERLFHERNTTNILKSGREWFGESYDTQNTLNYPFNMSGYVAGTPITVRAENAVKYGRPGGGTGTVPFNYFVNNQFVGSISFTTQGACNNCQVGIVRNAQFNIVPNLPPNASNINITVSADRSQDRGSATYQNYIGLQFTKSLSLTQSQMNFRVLASAGQHTSQYSLSANKSVFIWNVTKPTEPVQVASGNSNISFSENNNFTLQEYVAFAPNDALLTPANVWRINNQNLKGISSPDFIIITHPTFLAQAQRLAAHRRSQGTETEVVLTGHIYNEFSSGAQDVTAIRDFLRYVYVKGNKKLKNVLLFGGASFDYKYRTTNNTNFVPCYQSYESLHEIYSYSSEDYYGFLQDNVGDWVEGVGNRNFDHDMVIGVGRIPVNNPQEAEAVVNKLIHYDSDASAGRWRNRVTFLADNGSAPGEGNLFLNDSERLAATVSRLEGSMNITKLYIDAFPLVSKPTGFEVPQMNEAIRQVFNQGTLFLNYVGHGGILGLAQESIINKPLIESLRNLSRLPFWITATCDFSTYDNPAKPSAGMLVLTQRNGGGIGLLTSTRVVFSFTNYLLNQAFYDNVFKTDSLGNNLTLGEIIKLTKNQSKSSILNRNYTLLGDPSMKLGYAKMNAFVTSINGKASDTARALSEVQIEGVIKAKGSNTVSESFNGLVNIEIYDKPDTIPTFGQQFSIATRFTQQRNIIYAGSARVQNGKFSVQFMVPKDINYRIGKGKISLYAYDPQANIDAAGFSDSLYVGGSNPNARADNTPPTIQLFMDDTTFINGGITGEQPILIAKLFDESGINIARSSLGHGITAVINNNRSQPIDLNDAYESDINTYKSGRLKYSLPALPLGWNTLTLRAWDTHNNSAKQTIEFLVVGRSTIAIEKLMNYPNPTAGGHTTFSFIHSKAGEDLEVTLHITDLTGRNVATVSQTLPSSSPLVTIPVNFNQMANNITPGTYVYKCEVKSLNDNTVGYAVQKLVIIY